MPHEFPAPLERIVRPESTSQQERAAEQLARAQDICQLGDYSQILEAFSSPENHGLLECQKKRVKDEANRHALQEGTQALEEHDWEMLTILELFDRETYEHCVRTYTTAKQKIESANPVGEFLRAEIKKEGLTEWDIEHACLLHDMGKIVLIPKDVVLNNTLNDSAWHELFESFCHQSSLPEEAAKRQAYENTLTQNPLLREKDITPLRLALTEKENTTLTSLGIDTNLPLGAVIAKHQDISVAIVARYLPDSPLLTLIGNHHEKPLLPNEPSPISQSTVRISALISTLRMSDVFDALRSERPYKKSLPLLASLTLLIKEARQGFVDYDLARLWISDELDHLDIDAYFTTLKKNATRDFESEKKYLQDIIAFLPEPLKRAA